VSLFVGGYRRIRGLLKCVENIAITLKGPIPQCHVKLKFVICQRKLGLVWKRQNRFLNVISTSRKTTLQTRT